MELDAVAEIFAEKRVMRAAIDAVLEGRCGDAVIDGPCARLDLGFFAILAGDAAVAAAAPLVGAAPPPRVFIAADEWHDLIRRALPDAEPHVERRTRFSADGLEDTKLAALRGVPRRCRLEPLDADLLARALRDVSPDLLLGAVFGSPEAFAAGGGFGFAAVEQGRVLAAATSAIVAERRIEIQINTAEGRRRRGLATAVGAAIALEARRRGLDPGWDTGSAASHALARKLGYRPEEQHVALVFG